MIAHVESRAFLERARLIILDFGTGPLNQLHLSAKRSLASIDFSARRLKSTSSNDVRGIISFLGDLHKAFAHERSRGNFGHLAPNSANVSAEDDSPSCFVRPYTSGEGITLSKLLLILRFKATTQVYQRLRKC